MYMEMQKTQDLVKKKKKKSEASRTKLNTLYFPDSNRIANL